MQMSGVYCVEAEEVVVMTVVVVVYAEARKAGEGGELKGEPLVPCRRQ